MPETKNPTGVGELTFKRRGEGPYLFHDSHRAWSHGNHRGHSGGVVGLGAQLDNLLENVYSCGVESVTLEEKANRRPLRPLALKVTTCKTSP